MANGQTITYTGRLITTTCWCGIYLAVPSALYEAAQSDSSKSIHCPVGHRFVYSTNKATRLQAELDQMKASRDQQIRWRFEAEEEAARERRRAAAARGQITKLRKRMNNGVCPVPGCKRSFAQVIKHVKTAHPEWAHEHPEVLGG